MRRDYRIFVGAVPTGELAERIQALRERYDPKTARITAPHVTLAGTYWRSGPATPENEAQAIQRLLSIQNQIQPFELTLGGIFTFPPTKEPVIYLGVESTAGLLAARQRLLQALEQEEHHRFSPHLTLAMRLKGGQAQAMLDELHGSQWDAERWSIPIHELWLMQRGPADPAWRDIARLALGRGPQ